MKKLNKKTVNNNTIEAYKVSCTCSKSSCVKVGFLNTSSGAKSSTNQLNNAPKVGR